MAEGKFLEYKGRPLVRSGDVIYYGNMNDEFAVRFTVLDADKSGDIKLSKEIKIELIETAERDKAVKSSVKNGFFEAMDLGYVWLERALKK